MAPRRMAGTALSSSRNMGFTIRSVSYCRLKCYREHGASSPVVSPTQAVCKEICIKLCHASLVVCSCIDRLCIVALTNTNTFTNNAPCLASCRPKGKPHVEFHPKTILDFDLHHSAPLPPSIQAAPDSSQRPTCSMATQFQIRAQPPPQAPNYLSALRPPSPNLLCTPWAHLSPELAHRHHFHSQSLAFAHNTAQPTRKHPCGPLRHRRSPIPIN